MTRDFYAAARAAAASLIHNAEKFPCDATKLVAINTIQAYQRIGLFGDGYAARLIKYVEGLKR